MSRKFQTEAGLCRVFEWLVEEDRSNRNCRFV